MEKRDLSNGDLNFYKENGYLHIPKFFDEDYCKKLMDEAERVAAGDYRFYLAMHKESELFLETFTPSGYSQGVGSVAKCPYDSNWFCLFFL